MKSKVLERKMFKNKEPEEVANPEDVGIMQGFIEMISSEEIDEKDAEEYETNRMMGRTPDSPEIIMNNLRGDMKSVDARREELADKVGYNVAMETPDEVLALLQDKFAQEDQQGLASLAPQGMPPGMPPGMMPAGGPPMLPPALPPEGIANLPTQQGPMPAPIPMKDGGIVQNFRNGSLPSGVTPIVQRSNGTPNNPIGGEISFDRLSEPMNILDLQIAPRYGAYKRAMGDSSDVTQSQILSLLSGKLFDFAKSGDFAKEASGFVKGISPVLAQAAKRDDALKLMAIKAAEDYSLAGVRAQNKGMLTGSKKAVADNINEWNKIKSMKELKEFNKRVPSFLVGFKDLYIKDETLKDKLTGKETRVTTDIPEDHLQPFLNMTGGNRKKAIIEYNKFFGSNISEDKGKLSTQQFTASILGRSFLDSEEKRPSLTTVTEKEFDQISRDQLGGDLDEVTEDVTEDVTEKENQTLGGLFYVPKVGSVTEKQMYQPLKKTKLYDPTREGLYTYAEQLTGFGYFAGIGARVVPETMGGGAPAVQIFNKARNLAQKSVPNFIANVQRMSKGQDVDSSKVGTGSYMAKVFFDEMKNIVDLESELLRSNVNYENAVLQNQESLLKIREGLLDILKDAKKVEEAKLEKRRVVTNYKPDDYATAKANLTAVENALSYLNVPPMVRTKEDYNKVPFGSPYILGSEGNRPRQTITKAPTFGIQYNPKKKDKKIGGFPTGYVGVPNNDFNIFKQALRKKYRGASYVPEFPVLFQLIGGPRDGETFEQTIKDLTK